MTYRKGKRTHAILYVLLCVALFLLSACGSGTAAGSKSTPSPAIVDPYTLLGPVTRDETFVPGYNLIVPGKGHRVLKAGVTATERGESDIELTIVGAYADGAQLNILFDYGDYVGEMIANLKGFIHAFSGKQQLTPVQGGGWSIMEANGKTRIWVVFDDPKTDDIRLTVKDCSVEFALSANPWQGSAGTLGQQLDVAGREVTCLIYADGKRTTVDFFSPDENITSFGNNGANKVPRILSPRGFGSRLTPNEINAIPYDIYTFSSKISTYFGGKIELPCIQVRQSVDFQLSFTVPEDSADIGTRLGEKHAEFEVLSVTPVKDKAGFYTINFDLYPNEGQKDHYDLVTNATLTNQNGEELIWGVHFDKSQPKDNPTKIGYTFKGAKAGDVVTLKFSSMVVELNGPWEFDIDQALIQE